MTTPSSAASRNRAGWLAGQLPQADPGAVTVIPAGAGTVINVGGMRGLMKISPGDCDGALEAHVQDVAPGQLVAAHLHAYTAQWSFVTRGRLVFRVGGETHELEEGGFIWRPAGLVHAVLNPGREHAQHFEGNMPGGSMLAYYGRYNELTAGGPADPDEITALASAYGLFFDPGLTAELERAYQVSAPPPGGRRP